MEKNSHKPNHLLIRFLAKKYPVDWKYFKNIFYPTDPVIITKAEKYQKFDFC